MITTNGKIFLKRYLAGQAGSVFGAISVGIGGAAPSANDERMQFEFARVPIDVTTFDFELNRLIFKGGLDEIVGGTIYEVGLWTDEVNSSAGNQASRLLTTFDSDTENWGVGATFTTSNTRIGGDSLLHTPAASGSASNLLTSLTFDFIDYSSQDTFTVAYHNGNSNASSIKVRFRTDASNYYEFTIASPSVGYGFSTFQKGTATVVGTPSWGLINEIEVRTTASGGAAAVSFDGIRLEDVDTVSPDYGLVARWVLSTPEVKVEGLVHDIECALQVTV